MKREKSAGRKGGEVLSHGYRRIMWDAGRGGIKKDNGGIRSKKEKKGKARRKECKRKKCFKRKVKEYVGCRVRWPEEGQ